jgi:hypothetical protein
MTRSLITRRIAPWLVGLFVFAQVAGVVPLMAAHTLHVFESKQVASDDDDLLAVGPRGAQHHHSIADLNDQCCAVHHLAGVLAYVLAASPVNFAHLVVRSFAPNVLIAADPIPPERPPKSSSLI